jgi:hypothetical protein
MRSGRFAVCIVVALIAAGICGVRPVSASTAMPITGGALGQEVVGPLDAAPEWTVTGGYVVAGQLGKGSFSFTGGGNGCSVSSGMARFTRSDGAVLTGTVSGTATCAVKGLTSFAEHLVVDLTSGTRDLVSAHLVLNGTATFLGMPYIMTPIFNDSFSISGNVTVTAPMGYAMTDQHGHVSAFGGTASYGNASTATATRIVMTPSHHGYWIVNATGQVYAFGDAHWYGNAPALLPGETVRSIASTPTTHGYWLFSSTGRVLPSGDAHFYGDMHAAHLSAPIIDATATADGHGYYLLGSDGGVFTFGDAHFYGSTGNLRLNQPVDGIAPTATGHGYWLVATDGGIFTFGDAHFRGSMGGHPLNRPVIAIARYGNGYLMTASDGGIFNFSNQPFFGTTTTPPADPTVAIASTG